MRQTELVRTVLSRRNLSERSDGRALIAGIFCGAFIEVACAGSGVRALDAKLVGNHGDRRRSPVFFLTRPRARLPPFTVLWGVLDPPGMKNGHACNVGCIALVLFDSCAVRLHKIDIFMFDP